MKNLAAILGVGVGGYLLWKMSKPTKVNGCTDSTATNYNDLATNDDGSCTYPDPNVTPPMGADGMEFGGSGGGKGSSTSSGNTGMGGGDPYDDSAINTKLDMLENEIDSNTIRSTTNESELGGVKSSQVAQGDNIEWLVLNKVDGSVYADNKSLTDGLISANTTKSLSNEDLLGWNSGLINTNIQNIGDKVNTTDYNTYKSQTNSALGNKADTSYVDSGLADKASQGWVQGALNSKANTTSVDALGADLETFSTKANANESALNGFEADLGTFDSELAEIEFEVTAAKDQASAAEGYALANYNNAVSASNYLQNNIIPSIGTKAETSYVNEQVGGLQTQIDTALAPNTGTNSPMGFSGGSRQRRSGFVPNAW
jgi:hypothetical protein